MQGKIIVADGSVTIQKVIKLILSPHGYEVECYSSGSDALNAVKTSVPSLVIADVGMSDMNGFELATALKEAPELRDIPIILLYSSFEEIDPEKFASSGAREKLSKPFDDKQLLELVDSLVLKRECDERKPLEAIRMDEGNEGDRFFTLGENEEIGELGVPDLSELPTEDEELPGGLATEDLSEEESQRLLEEFNLRENIDGTINFNETASEEEALWSDRFYSSEEEPSAEGKLDTGELPIDIPDIPLETLSDEQERIIEDITRETVEKMVQKILPDVVERLVREELSKIVSEE